MACLWLVSCGVDSHLAEVEDFDGQHVASMSGAAASPRTGAAYAVGDGWMIHGVHVTPDNLAKWAPVVSFHPQEHYLPCSIDDLLEGATLVDATGHVLQQHPGQTDLQHYRRVDDRLLIAPQRQAGEPLDSHGQVQAPMYVSAQVPPDAAFIDLNYIFLLGFNGTQTATLKLFGKSTDLLLSNFADHEGDIESISVRVTPDFQRAIFVRFEGHGHSHFVSPEDVTFISGTHVAVLSALHSHANYNARAFSDAHRHVEAKISALGFGLDVVDLTLPGGPAWVPFALDIDGRTRDIGRLHFVGLDEAGQVLGPERWAAYVGRIGDTRFNTFVGVRRLDGTRPTLAARTTANALINGAGAVGQTRRFNVAVGPLGLASRQTIDVTRPTWVVPKAFKP